VLVLLPLDTAQAGAVVLVATTMAMVALVPMA
jgi:hypothetical protein